MAIDTLAVTGSIRAGQRASGDKPADRIKAVPLVPSDFWLLRLLSAAGDIRDELRKHPYVGWRGGERVPKTQNRYHYAR